MQLIATGTFAAVNYYGRLDQLIKVRPTVFMEPKPWP